MRRRSEARRREAAARRERAQEFGRVVAERLGAADITVSRIWGFGSTYETSRPYRLELLRAEFDHAALGYTLHNLYSAFEGYFLRVAKFFENELESKGWHESLLDRMTLAVPELRPALIDRALAERLRELLMFRHAFRNIYSSTPIPEKVLFVNRIAEKIDEDFRQCHEQFTLFLDSLAQELNDDTNYE